MPGKSFLGRGWSFPPAFGRGGADVEMVSDAEDVHQSLQILLSTQPSERLMREDYGCDLTSVMFEEADQALINRLSSLISDAILNYEPRVELEKLNIAESQTEPGLLMVSIDYSIKGTNSRFNMVYPFYLKEAVISASLT